MRTARSHSFPGSALMVVLWALVVLSATVLAWGRWIQQDLQLAGNANRGTEARAMAHSGVAMALNPAITKKSPMLQEELASAQGYRVRLISEGGKLNPTWLMIGEDPRKLALFKLWLEHQGLKYKERDAFIDCALDYVDADNLHRANGVEDDGDYHAPNRPLQSIEEIRSIRGADALMRSPGWQEELTLESSGPIDLLAASAEILRLLPGFSEVRIQRLLNFRAGTDKVDGTADDPEVKDLNQVLSNMGISQAEAQGLNGLIMVNDPIVRILAEGHSGKVSRQIEVVARKTGGYPQILSWKE